MRLIRLSLALLAALSAAPGWAESGDREQPIEIFARDFAGDEVSQVGVYTGDVEVHQGSLEIFGDRLTLTVSPDGYRTVKIVGQPVRLRQRRDPDPKRPGIDEWVHASGLTAVYDEREDRVTLTDNARVARSENGQIMDSSEGQRITYDLLTARSRIEGGERNGRRTRVTTVLAPRERHGGAPVAPSGNAETRRPALRGADRLSE